MSLKEKLSADLKQSMKAQDRFRTGVLRMLLSELKYAQAATNASKEMSDDETVRVFSTYHKRLTKSLDDFPDDQRKQEIRREIRVVEEYLPTKAGRDQVEKTIDGILGSSPERQFGPLMQRIMTQLGNAADGKLISEVLKEKLNS